MPATELAERVGRAGQCLAAGRGPPRLDGGRACSRRRPAGRGGCAPARCATRCSRSCSSPATGGWSRPAGARSRASPGYDLPRMAVGSLRHAGRHRPGHPQALAGAARRSAWFGAEGPLEERLEAAARGPAPGPRGPPRCCSGRAGWPSSWTGYPQDMVAPSGTAAGRRAARASRRRGWCEAACRPSRWPSWSARSRRDGAGLRGARSASAPAPWAVDSAADVARVRALAAGAGRTRRRRPTPRRAARRPVGTARRRACHLMRRLRDAFDPAGVLGPMPCGGPDGLGPDPRRRRRATTSLKCVAVRALPAALPHLPPHRARDRLAARAHRRDAGGGGGRGPDRRLVHADDGRVPGLPGLRGGLPERRPLRAHDRGGPGPDRAAPPAPGAGPQARRPGRGPAPAAGGAAMAAGLGAAQRRGPRPAGAGAPSARRPRRCRLEELQGAAARRAGRGAHRGALTGCVMDVGLPTRAARHDAAAWPTSGYRAVRTPRRRLLRGAGDALRPARRPPRRWRARASPSWRAPRWWWSTPSGCSAHMKSYGELLADDRALGRPGRAGGRAGARPDRAAPGPAPAATWARWPCTTPAITCTPRASRRGPAPCWPPPARPAWSSATAGAAAGRPACTA